LQVEVLTAETPHNALAARAAQCGSASAPLQAIGNEAVVCNPNDEANGKRAARLVGRVRNRMFIVLFVSTDPAAAPDLLKEKVRAVGELVAGNLF
jgi:hypothetical protein